MKTSSAYKTICQEEKIILQDTAQKVAMLVDKSPKKMDYFRKQLTTFADKWTAYETAKEAERKGKWQPSMGRPSNPLWAIWPRNAGASCFPNFGDIPPVLGGYALLAVIHDNVLPNCPSIAKEVLPKELANKIWRDLITGANNELSIGSRWVIPTNKIERFLQEVKDDIANHFAPKSGTEPKVPETGENKAGETKRALRTTSKPRAIPAHGQVFICYSRKDKRWHDDLQSHLVPFVRNRTVTAWSDEQIAPGAEWFAEIKKALARTKVGVLLVTPDFLASDFIYRHELTPLLKEAKKGNVRIIWLPVRTCSFKETPLERDQAALDPAKPLAKMRKPDRDKAWVEICEEIKKAVGP